MSSKKQTSKSPPKIKVNLRHTHHFLRLKISGFKKILLILQCFCHNLDSCMEDLAKKLSSTFSPEGLRRHRLFWVPNRSDLLRVWRGREEVSQGVCSHLNLRGVDGHRQRSWQDGRLLQEVSRVPCHHSKVGNLLIQLYILIFDQRMFDYYWSFGVLRLWLT